MSDQLEVVDRWVRRENERVFSQARKNALGLPSNQLLEDLNNMLDQLAREAEKWGYVEDSTTPNIVPGNYGQAIHIAKCEALQALKTGYRRITGKDCPVEYQEVGELIGALQSLITKGVDEKKQHDFLNPAVLLAQEKIAIGIEMVTRQICTTSSTAINAEQVMRSGRAVA